MVAWFRCLLVNEQREREPHDYTRGVNAVLIFSPGLIPLNSAQKLRERDRRRCGAVPAATGVGDFWKFRPRPIAIFNQGDLIKILHRVDTFTRRVSNFCCVFDPKVHIDDARARARAHAFARSLVRVYVAPAAGMRKLSYSTSPRLTALELCAPVDKHAGTIQKKTIPYPRSCFSVMQHGPDGRFALCDISLNEPNVAVRASANGAFMFLCKVHGYEHVIILQKKIVPTLPIDSENPAISREEPLSRRICSAGSKLENR